MYVPVTKHASRWSARRHDGADQTETRDDDALIRLLRAGDEGGFDALFRKYWEKVYALCLRHVRSAETAREMTQDIFKSLWERRRELAVEGPLEHYLHRAAKYRVFNHYREKAVRKRYLETSPAPTHGEAPESAEDRMERLQFAAWTERLLDALPAACRTVFRLQQTGRLSQREIAQTLNISVKTVEFHLGNARRRLRAALRS